MKNSETRQTAGPRHDFLHRHPGKDALQIVGPLSVSIAG